MALNSKWHNRCFPLLPQSQFSASSSSKCFSCLPERRMEMLIGSRIFKGWSCLKDPIKALSFQQQVLVVLFFSYSESLPQGFTNPSVNLLRNKVLGNEYTWRIGQTMKAWDRFRFRLFIFKLLSLNSYIFIISQVSIETVITWKLDLLISMNAFRNATVNTLKICSWKNDRKIEFHNATESIELRESLLSRLLHTLVSNSSSKNTRKKSQSISIHPNQKT